jgi:hypothetical protein
VGKMREAMTAKVCPHAVKAARSSGLGAANSWFKRCRGRGAPRFPVVKDAQDRDPKLTTHENPWNVD